MVNNLFFNYVNENGEKISDEYEKWDNDIEYLDDNLAFDYVSLEHNRLGTIYVEMLELNKLITEWIGMSKEQREKYNY